MEIFTACHCVMYGFMTWNSRQGLSGHVKVHWNVKLDVLCACLILWEKMYWWKMISWPLPSDDLDL